MSKSEYYEKLKDPRWQKKRLEIMERDRWKCKKCGNKENTLNVHHIAYFKNYEPWEVPDGFLITFCEQCHKGSGPQEAIEYIGKLLDYIWRIPGGLQAIRKVFKLG
jgi:5-methylcytosine-specific restriction endonuclease McrA